MIEKEVISKLISAIEYETAFQSVNKYREYAKYQKIISLCKEL